MAAFGGHIDFMFLAPPTSAAGSDAVRSANKFITGAAE